MLAAGLNYIDIVDALLKDSRVRLNICNKSRLNASLIAQSTGHAAMLELLLAKGGVLEVDPLDSMSAVEEESANVTGRLGAPRESDSGLLSTKFAAEEARRRTKAISELRLLQLKTSKRHAEHTLQCEMEMAISDKEDNIMRIDDRKLTELKEMNKNRIPTMDQIVSDVLTGMVAKDGATIFEPTLDEVVVPYSQRDIVHGFDKERAKLAQRHEKEMEFQREKEKASASPPPSSLHAIRKVKGAVSVGPPSSVIHSYFALHAAVKANDIAAVQSLIALMGQQDLNLTDEDGRTALHWAAFHGRIEVAEMLLSDLRMNIDIADRVCISSCCSLML